MKIVVPLILSLVWRVGVAILLLNRCVCGTHAGVCMMRSVCLDVLWLLASPSVVFWFWLVSWGIIALLSVVVAVLGAYARILFQGGVCRV
jgi:hypothetical protein